jgi:hypothetical protein
MPPPVAAAWSIGQRLRNGMRIVLPGGRSGLNWRATRRSGGTCRTGWPVGSWRPAGQRSGGRWCRGRAVGTDDGSIGDGLGPGVQHRSLTVFRWTFPKTSMRISHEAIYQALYVQGRGALRRELTACLRTGRALRVPRARVRGRGKSFVTPEILISQRPATVLDRAVPGHWEGDLILGLASSAIGTLVERTTRYTVLLYLPPLPEHGLRPRVKNGPALTGHGAEAVRDAITRTMASFPTEGHRFEYA